MSKNSLAFGSVNLPAVVEQTEPPKGGAIEIFAFGDAEGVLDRRELIASMESLWNGRYYEPPVPPKMLARMLNIAPHHRSAIAIKKNMLTRAFVPHPLLSRAEFGQWVQDYLVMANGYVEAVPAMSGKPIGLKASLAMGTRRGKKDGQYFFVNDRQQIHEFRAGSIFHLRDQDVSQELYGVPEYLSAMQAAFLNEAATLFRRRYYLNGAHAGFIFYLNEATVSHDDADNIREQLKAAKGVGNFKNLFVHCPTGKKDGIQIIPIAEVAAKDEFMNIKNVTRDDILAAHRVPPQLMSVLPANTGGFGDVEKAAAIFHRFEIEPLQARFMEINEWLGEEVVTFLPYEPISSSD